MKKTMVQSKSGYRFGKRLTALFAAAIMMASASPAVMAEETAAEPKKTYTEELSWIRAIDFDNTGEGIRKGQADFTSRIDSVDKNYRVERIPDYYYSMQTTISQLAILGHKPGEDGTVHELVDVTKRKSDWTTETGPNKNKKGLNTGDFWTWTKNSVFAITQSWYGTWPQTSSTPGSGLRFGGIYGGKDVQVGDKIRVTARIYPSGARIWYDNGNGTANKSRAYIDDPKTNLTDSDGKTKKMGDVYPTAPTEQPVNMFLSSDSYAANNPAGEQYTGKINFNEWNEVVLEYTVSEENKSVDSIRIDFADRTKTTTPCHYPCSYQVFIGGVKTEKVFDAADVETTGYIEDVSKITAKSFSENVYAKDDNIDEITSTDGEYTIQRLSEAGLKPQMSVISSNASDTKVEKIDSEWNYNTYQGADGLNTGNFSSWTENSVFRLAHVWGEVENYQSGGSPYAGLRFCNIYGENKDEIEPGDRIRITAKVYPANTGIWSFTGDYETTNTRKFFINDPWSLNWTNNATIITEADGTEVKMQDAYPTAPTEQNVNMFLSAYRGDGNPDNYAVNNPDPDQTEQYSGKIKFNEWNDVVLEYTVTEFNRDIDSVRLDFADRTVQFPAYYPCGQKIYIGGIQVQKIVGANGSYTKNGSEITGTIKANGNCVKDDGVKVIVVAYDDKNTFLGCDIVGAPASENIFEFAVSDVADAASVQAYIWNTKTLKPLTDSINLTYTEPVVTE